MGSFTYYVINILAMLVPHCRPNLSDILSRKDNFFFEKRQFYYLSPIQYIINKYIYPNKFDLRFKRYKYANS